MYYGDNVVIDAVTPEWPGAEYYVRVKYVTGIQKTALKRPCIRCKCAIGIQKTLTVLSVFRDITQKEVRDWEGNQPIQKKIHYLTALTVAGLKGKHGVGNTRCANEKCPSNAN